MVYSRNYKVLQHKQTDATSSDLLVSMDDSFAFMFKALHVVCAAKI